MEMELEPSGGRWSRPVRSSPLFFLLSFLSFLFLPSLPALLSWPPSWRCEGRCPADDSAGTWAGWIPLAGWLDLVDALDGTGLMAVW